MLLLLGVGVGVGAEGGGARGWGRGGGGGGSWAGAGARGWGSRGGGRGWLWGWGGGVGAGAGVAKGAGLGRGKEGGRGDDAASLGLTGALRSSLLEQVPPGQVLEEGAEICGTTEPRYRATGWELSRERARRPGRGAFHPALRRWGLSEDSAPRRAKTGVLAVRAFKG